MSFHFTNTKKDFILTDEDKEDFDNIIICHFYEKEILIDKVRDHCV